MRKITAFMVFVLCISIAYPVDATRRRYLEREQQTQEQEEEKSIDYGSVYYIDNLPGSTFNPDDLKDYTYDGIPINIPDFSRHRDYEAEDIKTFSDAIVDYLGWDSMLGVSGYDLQENFLTFRPIKGVSSNANRTIGYGRRKFGSEPIEFKARICNDDNSGSDIFAGWMGIMVRASSTQSAQWQNNPGYLFVIKHDAIELQRWFPDQTMLTVVDNGAVNHGQWHEYLVGTEKTEQGLKITLHIDGQEMLSVVDDNEPIAPEEGHVAFYCSTDKIDFMPVNTTLNSSGETITKGEYGNITALKVGQSRVLSAGVQAQIDEENVNVVPKVANDRVFVPLRFVADAIGAVVEWNEEYRTVDLNYRGREITLTEGFAEYGVDGVYRKLDAAPFIEHGRLYVPIRAISEAFSKNVLWTDEQIVFVLENGAVLDEETKSSVFAFFSFGGL